jgi:hypothetical protein
MVACKWFEKVNGLKEWITKIPIMNEPNLCEDVVCAPLGHTFLWAIQYETTHYAIRPDSGQNYKLENMQERMFLKKNDSLRAGRSGVESRSERNFPQTYTPATQPPLQRIPGLSRG